MNSCKYLGSGNSSASRWGVLAFQLSLLCKWASGTWTGLTIIQHMDLGCKYIWNLLEQNYAEDLRDVIRDREISLTPLFKAIKEFERAAIKIKDQIKVTTKLKFRCTQWITSHNLYVVWKALEESKSWVPMLKKSFAKVRELNDRLIMAERAFTDDDGLFGRSWYKHLVSFLSCRILSQRHFNEWVVKSKL